MILREYYAYYRQACSPATIANAVGQVRRTRATLLIYILFAPFRERRYQLPDNSFRALPPGKIVVLRSQRTFILWYSKQAPPVLILCDMYFPTSLRSSFPIVRTGVCALNTRPSLLLKQRRAEGIKWKRIQFHCVYIYISLFLITLQNS